jgi:hypothetical protein
MQLVVATSPSPGCGQPIDDVEMLRRDFRRSSGGGSSSSSGVSSRHSPRHSSLSGFGFGCFPVAVLAAASSPGSLATFAAIPSGATRRLCRESGGVRKCVTCARNDVHDRAPQGREPSVREALTRTYDLDCGHFAGLRSMTSWTRTDILAYSITSSALVCRIIGTTRPSFFAVLKLFVREVFFDAFGKVFK